MELRLACAALIAVVLGCAKVSHFECQNDQQCVDGATRGQCEVNNQCSFPDFSCASGRRYSAHSAIGAGTCVEASSGSSSDGNEPKEATSSAADTIAPQESGSEATTRADESDTTDAGRPITVRFGERPDADVHFVTADTFVHENFDFNYGAHPDLHIWGESATPPTGLLRFDLSAIAFGAVVLEAELALWAEPGSEADAGELALFEMLESWRAGVENGGPGAANWIDRDDGVPWATRGAGPGSRAEQPFGVVAIPSQSQSVTVALPVALVEAWIDEPAANHGIALTSFDAVQYAAISSSEEGDTDLRPLLTVTFVP